MQASAYSVIAIHIGFGITELFRSNLFRKSGQFPHDAIIDVINTIMVLVVTQPTILHYGGPAVNYKGNFGNLLLFLEHAVWRCKDYAHIPAKLRCGEFARCNIGPPIAVADISGE